MLSIITCVYNGEDTIRDTIESVIAQDFDDYEHLIIDGNSKDSTLKIIQEYKIDKLKIVSENDNGIYDAYNKGVNLSKGDYLMFLNADDFLAENALNAASSFLKKTKDVIAFNIAMMDEKNEYYKIISRDSVPRHNVRNPIILTPSIIFRKEIFTQIGNFDSTYRICADYDFIARCLNANVDITYVDRLLTVMREGGISSNYKFELIKKREQALVYMRNSKSINLSWIFTLALKFSKTIILQTLFKKRLIKKKKSSANKFDEKKIFWFK